LDGANVPRGAASTAEPGLAVALEPIPTQSAGGDFAALRDAALAFFFGPENRAVQFVLETLLDDEHVDLEPNEQGPSGRRFSPLVLIGPSGVGKTHLARVFAEAWATRRGAEEVVVASCSDFAAQLADAIRRDAVFEFRRRHRTARLLVLDGLGHLKTKRAAQQELLSILDALADLGSVVVVTSTEAPVAMRALLPSLASRLSGGLVLPVAPPGEEARLRILLRLAQDGNIALPIEAARALAGALSGTAPELRAALLELHLKRQTAGVPLDARLVRDHWTSRGGVAPTSIDRIAALTARSFSLRPAQLRGASRKRSIALARGIAMYLARKMTGGSLEQIGRYFGGRDHTTVLYNCRKIEKSLEGDVATRTEVDRLRRLLCAR
jgi:chromosomal replication initiator protein